MARGQLSTTGVPADPPRVGVVSYLNAAPLAEGLEPDPEVDLVLAPPSAVAAGLAAGTLDVGLVPAIELLRQPGLTPVGDACIASLGAVQSVLVLLRRAPSRIRHLSLDPHSRTSQVLARLCLRDLHGVEPEATEREGPNPWTGGEDAALIIGDPALRCHHAGEPGLDLGREWHRLTGLPFVFAVWAGQEDRLRRWPDLGAKLTRARDAGVARLGAIAHAWASPLGLPPEMLQVYLERRIRYRLGSAEEEGLRRFLALARPLAGADPATRTAAACSTSDSSGRTPAR